MAQRDIKARRLFRDDLGDPLLMTRMKEGEQESYGNGLNAVVAQCAYGPARRIFVEGHSDFPVWPCYALSNRNAMTASHQWAQLPRQIELETEVVGALVPRDVENVAEALSRN